MLLNLLDLFRIDTALSTERIRKIMNSFDLGFSDYFPNENVRQLTLTEKIVTMESATDFLTVEESMNFSIFNKKGAEHPTAEIYAIDFPSDFRASVYLLLGGYYRQAILCLRNWLEVRLTGIFFGFVNPDEEQHKNWKKGKKRAPIAQILIKRLFSRAEFQRADKEVGLHLKLNKLMAELSAFSHCSILEQYDLQSKTDNVPRFNPQSVDLWFDFALRTFREIVFCYFVAYGRDAFATHDKEELKMLENYLPADYKQKTQESGIL
jgi:hypothetical protein